MRRKHIFTYINIIVICTFLNYLVYMNYLMNLYLNCKL